MPKRELPKSVNVLGTEWKIKYVERHCDVDPGDNSTLKGQVDFLHGTFRVQRSKKQRDATLKTVLHEAPLYDTLKRNGWLKM